MMTGWKTWVAGIGMIATGFGLIGKEIAEGTHNYSEGIQMVLAGLGLIGIGHKIEKTI